MAGSLCEPLCTSREIRYSQCIPVGKDKVFVARARWRKREVVLKSMEVPKLSCKLLKWYKTLTAEEFKRKVIDTPSSGVFAVYMYGRIFLLIYLSLCLSICPSDGGKGTLVLLPLCKLSCTVCIVLT